MASPYMCVITDTSSVQLCGWCRHVVVVVLQSTVSLSKNSRGASRRMGHDLCILCTNYKRSPTTCQRVSSTGPWRGRKHPLPNHDNAGRSSTSSQRGRKHPLPNHLDTTCRRSQPVASRCELHCPRPSHGRRGWQFNILPRMWQFNVLPRMNSYMKDGVCGWEGRKLCLYVSCCCLIAVFCGGGEAYQCGPQNRLLDRWSGDPLHICTVKPSNQ